MKYTYLGKSKITYVEKDRGTIKTNLKTSSGLKAGAYVEQYQREDGVIELRPCED